MFWGCSGTVLEVFWGDSGGFPGLGQGVLGMFRVCSRVVLGLLRGSTGGVPGVYLKCSGTVLWGCSGSVPPKILLFSNDSIYQMT